MQIFFITVPEILLRSPICEYIIQVPLKQKSSFHFIFIITILLLFHLILLKKYIH